MLTVAGNFSRSCVFSHPQCGRNAAFSRRADYRGGRGGRERAHRPLDEKLFVGSLMICETKSQRQRERKRGRKEEKERSREGDTPTTCSFRRDVPRRDSNNRRKRQKNGPARPVKRQRHYIPDSYFTVTNPSSTLREYSGLKGRKKAEGFPESFIGKKSNNIKHCTFFQPYFKDFYCLSEKTSLPCMSHPGC